MTPQPFNTVKSMLLGHWETVWQSVEHLPEDEQQDAIKEAFGFFEPLVEDTESTPEGDAGYCVGYRAALLDVQAGHHADLFAPGAECPKT